RKRERRTKPGARARDGRTARTERPAGAGCERRDRRHRRPDRCRRRARGRDDARTSPRAGTQSRSVSRREQCLRVLRGHRRSDSHRTDRHERRRPSGNSVSLNPMYSRDQVLALMRDRVHHPAAMRELLQVLKVPRDERTSFQRHVKSLVSSGDLIQFRGQRFGLPEKMDLCVGRLQTHPAGYGFVAPERPLDSGGGDIYISNPHLNEAMHGDRVVVRIERIKEGGRAEGRVIRVLERSNTSLVGRYDRDDAGMGHVAPFDRRVLMDLVVPPGQEGGASPGDMVGAELTRWPTATRSAIGRVAEVLGDIDAPGVDTEIIIRTFGIPDAHPADAIAEAVRLGTTVSERDIRGRSDFRDLLTVTIDGEHARDFDDAITLEKLRNGSFWLGVHIADVSHYVQDGSALDREAYDRGTSVYFPGRAVHMFPAELATGLCSLNPHVDRLVQSCFMEVDRRGQVVRHAFHDGVINSSERMTYTAVNGILTDRDPALLAQYAPLVPMFDELRELFQILNDARRRDGDCRTLPARGAGLHALPPPVSRLPVLRGPSCAPRLAPPSADPPSP